MANVIIGRGRIRGVEDRRRRDKMGEKLEGLRKRSLEVKRQTGAISGPFKIRDWER